MPDDNFVFGLASTFQLIYPEMPYDVALANASSIFSSALWKVDIKDAYGTLTLTEMDAIIGSSGFGKTKGLEQTRRLAKNLFKKLPNFPTTEGITKWLADTEKSTDGIIVNDEFSRRMKESAVKTYSTGTIEMYSSLYDHNIDDSYTITHGLQEPRPPYFCVLFATYEHYLPHISDDFFSSGLAGRFNWTFVPHQPVPDQPKEYHISDTAQYDLGMTQFDESESILKCLIQVMNHRDERIILLLDKQVDPLYDKVRHYAESLHEQGYLFNKWECDFQFYKRIPEMVLKQAGRYAIGRCIEQAIHDKFGNICITSNDFNLGWMRIKKSIDYLNDIFQLRREGVVQLQQKSHNKLPAIYSPTYIAFVLKHYGLMNTTQLQKTVGISDYATFDKYLTTALQQKLIIEVNKDDITDVMARKKLGANNTKTRIWANTEK